jgi:acetolactate synthase-1/2/3 large subunit
VLTALINVLEEAGVELVLGLPGGDLVSFFAQLHDHPTIRTILVREESLGSMMAEAYGRTTGSPIVVAGQGAWIVGNAGQGILEAKLGSAPVIVMTEMSDGGWRSHHAPYQGGSGDYGAWDTRRALSGVAKTVMVSHYPAQAVQQTQLAFKHALTGQPGPVAVVYRGDSLRGIVGADSQPRLYPTSSYLPEPDHRLDEAAIERAAAAIRGASRPVIVAGNGVRVGQAKAELAAFARAIDVPVATTTGGKGVFPERDPLALGPIGSYGLAAAVDVVGAADLVLAVGTKLGPMDTGDERADLIDPTRQTLIQIDVEPLNAGWAFPVDHALLGRAADILSALQAAIKDGDAPAPRPASVDIVAEAFARFPELDTPDFTSDEMPFVPQRVISALQRAVPDDVVVTADAGENRIFMLHWFRAPEGSEYLQPAGAGGMGYAIPAALGCRLAYPDRPVVAVTGDGGFAMSMNGLMTAVHEGLPIGVVVLNNAALGWTYHGGVTRGAGDFDLAGVARAIGCEAVRPTSAAELDDALKACLVATKPFVVDVPMSLEKSFRDVQTL